MDTLQFKFTVFTSGPAASRLATMSTLISFILHPLITLNVLDDDGESGIDVFYLLSLFFGFGIWLVFDRYHKAHNSPVPFIYNAPAVCLIL